MSSDKPILYIIVPILNEKGNLERLLQGFRGIESSFADRLTTKCILVDDGSTDGSAEHAKSLAQSLDLTVLSHAQNEGPGRAFGTAFAYLAEILRPEDWVATMEGDNTSRHEILTQMMHRTEEGYDVILASPYMYGGGVVHTVWHRTFLSHIANLTVKQFLGIRGIMTMSSFYRLHKGEFILKLQKRYGERILERSGFESMIEMLMKEIYLSAKISEVPMVLDTALRVGKSKMKVLRTICGHLTLWRHKSEWREPGDEE